MASRRFLAIAALVLTPFGSVSEHTTKDGAPWHAFDADGAVLVVLRAERGTTPSCNGAIRRLERGLESFYGAAASGPLTESSAAWSAWDPFESKDLDAVKDCDDFPCDVKLDRAETQAMASVPEDSRKARYLELVSARVERYRKTQERREYEFAGTPVDPWKRLSEMGFKTSLQRPSSPVLRIRKRVFDFGSARAVRQVFDVRLTVSKDRKEVVLWVRDAYTDHFFDGWGEWAQLKCDDKGWVLTHALLVELDLLKKGDIFSRVARPRMRSAVEDTGGKYLDDFFKKRL